MAGGPMGSAGMGGSCWCCLLPSRLAMRATTGRLGMASGFAPAVTAAAAAAAAVAAARASCWRVSSGGGVLWQLSTCSWRSGSSQFQLYTPARGGPEEKEGAAKNEGVPVQATRNGAALQCWTARPRQAECHT